MLLEVTLDRRSGFHAGQGALLSSSGVGDTVWYQVLPAQVQDSHLPLPLEFLFAHSFALPRCESQPCLCVYWYPQFGVQVTNKVRCDSSQDRPLWYSTSHRLQVASYGPLSAVIQQLFTHLVTCLVIII